MRHRLLALLWEESHVQGDIIFGGEQRRTYQGDIATLRDDWRPVADHLPPAETFPTSYQVLVALNDKGGVAPMSAPATAPDFTRVRPETIKIGAELPAYLEALRTFTMEVAGLKCKEGEKLVPPLWALEVIHQQVTGTYDPTNKPIDDSPESWWPPRPDRAFARADITIEVRGGKANVTSRAKASTGISISPSTTSLTDRAAEDTAEVEDTIVFFQWEDLNRVASDILARTLIPFLHEEIQRATHRRNTRGDAERKLWEALPWLAHWLYSGEFPGPSEEECEGLTDDQIDKLSRGPAIKRRKDITRELAREAVGIEA